MNVIEKGQVNQSAAEIYEQFFLPALFADWPPYVAAAANIQPGNRVLDVACGTGVLARWIADQVGPMGSVIGLDINEGMLDVARRQATHITWQNGRAEDLPFDDDSFDAVVSQFGLMFFDNKRQALQEIVRVLRPNGRFAVAVWDTLDNTPGYAAMVKLLQQLFGEEAANGLRTPYNLGNIQTLESLFADMPITNVDVMTKKGTARFASISDWMYTDIKGWVLADMIDDDQFALLLKEASRVLRPFLTETGTIAFDAPAHIVTAVKL
ncbi:MAG: methyltransferase domain-containing protein [Anaerolineales bacterium]|nr:methyltransferase domain-containing protein [Anaerolineales bacterium]